MKSIFDKKKELDWTLIALLAGMFVLIAVFWNFVLFYPFKLFVVLLHELSHGLAAVLTGGRIVAIEITQDLGGVCTTVGGWQFLVVMAGYLGSMLWGGLILILAARTSLDKIIAAVIGGVVLIVTIIFIRPVISFGFLFGVVFGLAIGITGWLAPEIVNDILLKFIGLTSVMYAVIDIKEDLISRDIPGSDAFYMSQIIPLPPVVWGIIWGLIALAAAFFLIRYAARKDEKSPTKSY
ncbi:MAG: hypothetical protein A2Y33_02215 [Spirochaetes bacterium GWF1_51_8]|nr:MAG: hypothetical protein A2Y33_02215 [Spirochaetes bacterium GWF1_51_8]